MEREREREREREGERERDEGGGAYFLLKTQVRTHACLPRNQRCSD